MMRKILGFLGLGAETDLTNHNARRRRLLNVVLMAMWAVIIIVLLALLVFAPRGLGGTIDDMRMLVIACVVALAGTAGIWLLNRYVSQGLATLMLLLLLIGIAALADTPEQVADGRGLVMFAIPIVAASVLLRPWGSFVTAGLSAAAVATVGLTNGVFPNIPALAGFLLLATVSWHGRPQSGRLHGRRQLQPRRAAGIGATLPAALRPGARRHGHVLLRWCADGLQRRHAARHWSRPHRS